MCASWGLVGVGDSGRGNLYMGVNRALKIEPSNATRQSQLRAATGAITNPNPTSAVERFATSLATCRWNHPGR